MVVIITCNNSEPNFTFADPRLHLDGWRPKTPALVAERISETRLNSSLPPKSAKRRGTLPLSRPTRIGTRFPGPRPELEISPRARAPPATLRIPPSAPPPSRSIVYGWKPSEPRAGTARFFWMCSFARGTRLINTRAPLQTSAKSHTQNRGRLRAN
jgi:hypothetical protein